MANIKILNKVIGFKNKIMALIEKYLSKKVEEYKEHYLITFNREPKEIEIRKFRKEVVMKVALYLYIPFIIISIMIWQTIEGGIFG